MQMLYINKYLNLLIINIFLLIFIICDINAVPSHLSNNNFEKLEPKIYSQNQNNKLKYMINEAKEPDLQKQVIESQIKNKLCINLI